MPLLLQLQDKGPPERENAGHGPRSRTSECHSKYLSELNAQPDLLQRRTIGAKERTGFTKGNAQSPLDFLPPSQALLGDPVLLRGRSVTKPDFLPVTNPQGSEFLPVLAQGSERETGYSRANDRMLNPRVTPPGPAPSSTAHGHFLHPRPMQQTNVALLGHQTIGTKESTGFSINTGGYICSPGNPDRDSQYLTTYSQGFFENIPKGLDREGWTRGGIHPLKPSGYTLNQGLTCLEHSPSAPESLWCPHSHRGRALSPADSLLSPSCRVTTWHAAEMGPKYAGDLGGVATVPSANSQPGTCDPQASWGFRGQRTHSPALIHPPSLPRTPAPGRNSPLTVPRK
ncbi:protein phosphatase 1 regulatory subunit 32 isoform X3 [Fukomys damarensis]|nr:protein phosphatase 1 regulatory subunit 32 isoform X3 [Fukomys damarensis]